MDCTDVIAGPGRRRAGIFRLLFSVFERQGVKEGAAAQDIHAVFCFLQAGSTDKFHVDDRVSESFFDIREISGRIFLSVDNRLVDKAGNADFQVKAVILGTVYFYPETIAERIFGKDFDGGPYSVDFIGRLHGDGGEHGKSFGVLLYCGQGKFRLGLSVIGRTAAVMRFQTE